MIKLVLDTDIGSEVDDAACLAYLLYQRNCSLLGITTTGSHPSARADVARRLVSLADRDDIPVVPGAGVPLVLPLLEQSPRQIPREQLTPEANENLALPFLRELLHLHPGEITLVSIAPLTNIALLFALAPETPRLLKRHIIMAGDFATASAARDEWNIRSDPHAAALVYRNACPDTLSLGQDTAGLVGLSATAFREQFQVSPILREVLNLADQTLSVRDFVRLDDAVAAVSVFEPGIVETIRADIDLAWERPASRAVPNWTTSVSGRHQLVRSVDQVEFFRHYFSVFHRPDRMEES